MARADQRIATALQALATLDEFPPIAGCCANGWNDSPRPDQAALRS